MNRSEFRLRKVKIDQKSVMVVYNQEGSVEEITSNKKVASHPDLKGALQVLCTLMTEVFDMPEDNQNKFTINGITLSEKKGTSQVLIMAVFETPTGMKTSLNTPNILLSGEDYVEQEKLEKRIEIIINEVWSYLFENKQAQQDLFSESDADEDDSEETSGELFNETSGEDTNES